jgi:hypothetical protein
MIDVIPAGSRVRVDHDNHYTDLYTRNGGYLVAQHRAVRGSETLVAAFDSHGRYRCHTTVPADWLVAVGS